MSRTAMLIALILCGVVAVAGEPSTAPSPRVIPVAELLRQLSSKDLAEREAASQRLSAMTFDPPPELLAATKSGTAELRERATKVAQAMRWNVAATRLPRGQRFAEKGRVDLFVAATAVWDLKPDDPRLWEPAVDLGRRLIEKAEMEGDRKPHNCPSSFRDFDTYLRLLQPQFTRMDKTYSRHDVALRNETIQAAGVALPGGICGNLIVSRGPIETSYAIQNSVVFANGDVTAVTGLFSVVIVCDGDVSLSEFSVNKVLIVARGIITIGPGVSSSAVLIAGGKVTLRDNRPPPPGQFNVIKENATDMLGITFFELSTVGLEVKAADKLVQVSAVANGKAFAKAGAQVGDVITEVNGKKPESAESLRRLLRDALAIGDATLTVKRGDKIETLKVALQE